MMRFFLVVTFSLYMSSAAMVSRCWLDRPGRHPSRPGPVPQGRGDVRPVFGQGPGDRRPDRHQPIERWNAEVYDAYMRERAAHIQYRRNATRPRSRRRTRRARRDRVAAADRPTDEDHHPRRRPQRPDDRLSNPADRELELAGCPGPLPEGVSSAPSFSASPRGIGDKSSSLQQQPDRTRASGPGTRLADFSPRKRSVPRTAGPTRRRTAISWGFARRTAHRLRRWPAWTPPWPRPKVKSLRRSRPPGISGGGDRFVADLQAATRISTPRRSTSPRR